MFDPRLIKKINRGNCFVLIGSGPSSELGYPSWPKLAELAHEEAAKRRADIDEDGYRKFLLQKDFPAVFEMAETDFGGRHHLISFLKSKLVRGETGASHIYDALIRWPFACYFTTNWDNELPDRLQQSGQHFTVLQNTVDDFAKIREGTRNVVVKIHSDLDHPTDVVITTTNYARYHVAGGYDYFRKKIRSILEMFDVLIVGHSLSDADLKYILQTARELGSPDHPIFMIAADVTQAERTRYLKQFNISVVSYNNDDGRHAALRRTLSLASNFIRGRSEDVHLEHYEVPAEEVETASSLFLYIRMQVFSAEAKSAHVSAVEPVVLSALRSADAGLDTTELQQHHLIRPLLNDPGSASEAIAAATSGLVKRNLVSLSGSKLRLNKFGHETLSKLEATRVLEADQAYGQFRLDLEKQVPSITKDVAGACEQLFRKSIVSVFRRRGMTIANAVFTNQPAFGDDLSDIFGVLAENASGLPDAEVAAAFIDGAQKFLVSPSEQQRNYLASVSQGFFLYHLTGKDPGATKVRKELFARTVWFIDSSLLIPFAAQGCHDHDYAVDLFARLRGVGANYYSTSGLLREVVEHFDWARNFVSSHPVYSPEFLEAVLARSNFKQNLFLDGFVRMVADGKVSTFAEYSRRLFSSGATADDIKSSLINSGVQFLDANDLEGFDQLDYGARVGIEEAVRSERQKRHSLKSDLQVTAEAEVYQIVRSLSDGTLRIPNWTDRPTRVYFVSHSNVLDSLSPGAILTWTPESVYRYLASLPGATADPELLQQCMLNDYYNIGVSFVDTRKYEKFFMPYITAAKIQFREYKERYLAYVESTHDVTKAFENTNDLDKPLFVEQMLGRLVRIEAERAEAATKRADEAEARAHALEAERDAAWKKRSAIREQQLAAEQRHQLDPDYLRKRQKQAAKRAKKKKKKQ